MSIEILYKFNMNKYKYEICDSENYELVDGSMVLYEYVNKMGVGCKVEIYFKSVSSQNLLGNDLFASVIDMPELYAKINFLNYEEYTNFILPNWLANFMYIN